MKTLKPYIANSEFCATLSKNYPGLVGDGAEIIGVDKNLAISAFEYGVLGITNRTEGKLRVLYSRDLKNFNWTDFDNDLDITKEFNWVDWASFFSYLGISKLSFHNQENCDKEIARYLRETHLFTKISDLINYHGAENICGALTDPSNFAELFSEEDSED